MAHRPSSGTGASMLSDIKALVAASEEVKQIEFETADFYERGSEIVLEIGAAYGLSAEALDDLFRAAIAR
jgi:hypothetical protein